MENIFVFFEDMVFTQKYKPRTNEKYSPKRTTEIKCWKIKEDQPNITKNHIKYIYHKNCEKLMKGKWKK